MRISLFIPCFVDQFYPQVGMSIVQVLERLGHTVDYPEAQTCCGQPAFNSGYWDEARSMAERQMSIFRDADSVVIASGSCGAMVKVFYPELFHGQPQEAQAKTLAAKTFEFSEFLVNKLGIVDVGAKFPGKATFHDGCHGLRELNVKKPPRQLLENVKGLELIEMKEAETCCGFGGTFAVKFPMISTAMGEVKCASIAETGADFIGSWLPDYDRRSQLHCHLSWHRALFEMACERPENARALYDDAIRPNASLAPPFFTLFDAAAFLWRWQLYGHASPASLTGEWAQLHNFARTHFPRAGIHFADLHAALAEAASGNDADALQRAEECRERERSGKLPQGPIVSVLCAGAAAFARGDYEQAVDLIGYALPELARVGGSHAQREIFEDTYIQACIRTGFYDEAVVRLRQRLARRPSARDRQWLEMVPNL